MELRTGQPYHYTVYPQAFSGFPRLNSCEVTSIMPLMGGSFGAFEFKWFRSKTRAFRSS